ncbi:MAG: TIGR03087 family PEP-CTERM/XrtA system glycosyltransferase [Polyangiales bacterium]
MRVLALTHRTPFPPDKGDKIRAHHLLTGVARRGVEVHLVAFAEPPSDAAYAARLRRDFASVTLIPLDLRVQRVRALTALLGATPLTVPAFDTAAMREAVDLRVRDLRPDVIFAESSSMAPYALAHAGVPLLMDFVDADSAKWRAYAEAARPPMSLIYAREARTLARFEREVALRARVSVITAARERALMNEIAPGCDVRVLANGVDTDYFAARSEAPTDASMVFFGAMDYAANVEAAVSLVREVLPKVRARHPEARVVIAGARPSAEVRRLAEDSSVIVTGYVSDMRPVVQGCALGVFPLRVARGVQNKVLEAMAMGVPVVTSPAVAEGVTATPGDEISVAPVDDAGASTAAAVCALLEDRAQARAMAARARLRVERDYGWAPRAAELHELLAEVALSAGRRGP